MPRSRFGLMPKIFLYLIGFCAILLVVLWLFQTVFLDSFYKAIKKNEVERLATTIAAAVEAGDEATLQAVGDGGEVTVELWSELSGTLALVSDRPQSPPLLVDERQKRQLLYEAREEGGFVSMRGAPQETFAPMGEGAAPLPGFGGMGFDRESILYACVVESPVYGEVLLTVSAEITPVSATVQTLRVQLVYISVLLAVLALGLALLISARVSRPIRRLNDAAGAWGHGNYDVKFAGGGYSEIEQLADTLNNAAGELAKTEALRRELVANVGHDLRTPLTLMAGYAEMMRDIPGEMTAENMQIIAEEAQRLSRLVDELMEFSRLQAGVGEMRPERFDLTQNVAAGIARIAKLSEAEGYTVEFAHSGHAQVVADVRRTEQVVYNFVINALAHTGADKRVEVRQKRRGGRVIIEVCDTGPGVPAAELANIWQRYYKAGAQRGGPLGSGLGLAIAKGALELQPGAEYGVRNRRGSGSVFWFSLPEAEEPETIQT